jgi:prepilin peptidase CpaA
MGSPALALSLIVLFAALTIAAWTDFRSHKIYNWTTYPGIVLCALARGWEDGREGLLNAGLGFAVCGGLMLVSYACLDLGGGDVKLAALMGVALGWIHGLYAILWMFILAGAMAAAVIVWRVGAWTLLARAFRRRDPSSSDARSDDPLDAQLRRPLFLAPAALGAVLIVTTPLSSAPTEGFACYAGRVGGPPSRLLRHGAISSDEHRSDSCSDRSVRWESAGSDPREPHSIRLATAATHARG